MALPERGRHTRSEREWGRGRSIQMITGIQTSGRRVVGLVAVFVCASLACGLPSNLTGGGTGSGGATAAEQPVPEGGVRLATVRSTEGVVEARVPPAADFSPV